MSRVAAIDVGTNSVRLLVADRTPDGLTEIERDLVITRLGEGVDAARMLGEAALERTVGAIARYRERAVEAGARTVRIGATSAVRDAANRADFVRAVTEATGVRPEVLSGEEEARLSFHGAVNDLREKGPYLVLDVGGGSTEFVRGRRDVDAWISLDIGSVRLTERHVRNDPPTEDEVHALAREADEAVARAGEVVNGEGCTLVGLAGTVTTIAAISLGLERYERSAIHHHRLRAEDLGRISAMLARMPVESRKELPVMPPGREDVIVAGAVILERVLSGFDFPHLIVSESDILDGLVLTISGDA